MLVVIEAYALSVVGKLPPDQETSVKEAVKRGFGGDDNWRATVKTTMGWPANVDEEILANWKTFGEGARDHEVAADPRTFAQAFADEFSKY